MKNLRKLVIVCFVTTFAVTNAFSMDKKPEKEKQTSNQLTKDEEDRELREFDTTLSFLLGLAKEKLKVLLADKDLRKALMSASKWALSWFSESARQKVMDEKEMERLFEGFVTYDKVREELLKKDKRLYLEFIMKVLGKLRKNGSFKKKLLMDQPNFVLKIYKMLGVEEGIKIKEEINKIKLSESKKKDDDSSDEDEGGALNMDDIDMD